VKLAERRRALELLGRHPGWGDSRVAGFVGVAPSSVTRWRQEEGLLPAVKRVGSRRRRASVVIVPLIELLFQRKQW
jgi:hypothetical protein